MSTLYDLHGELLALGALLAEVGGDVTDADAEAAIDAWFAEVHDARDEKLDAYGALIREFQARSNARKDEADRLAGLARVDENAAKRLKARLQWFLDEHGLRRVETARFRFVVAQNGGKAPVHVALAPDLLPAPYRRVHYTADLDAIRAALEAGESLEFARLEERGKHLRIA
jgi:hypothetical protein